MWHHKYVMLFLCIRLNKKNHSFLAAKKKTIITQQYWHLIDVFTLFPSLITLEYSITPLKERNFGPY